MPNIGSIDSYDGQENFKQYLQRLDFYFSANQIGLDYMSNDDTKKAAALEQRKAAFLAIVGKKTYQLLNNILAPQSAIEVKYDVILAKLSDYFVPAVLEVAESFRFHRVVQREGESIVSFVSRLREAASKCNYGAFLNRSLRDQFVSGVSDSETQRKLLEVERDFDACIKIALSVEVASKESVSFKSSNGVNYVKQHHHKPKQNKYPKPDSADKPNGKTQDKTSEICTYCQKKNHNAKNCFKRIREEKAGKTKGSKPTCYNMFNVSGTTAPLLVNVKIGNEIVTMEADSGAAISVMSVNNFNNLKLYDYSTRKTDDTVRSVPGTEKVHSIVTVPVTVHGETYRLDLRLLDTSCPNLYGRDWILATNVSIDNIMKEISKLSTVDIMQLSDHGNEMQPTSDHGNVMQPQSDHGNVMQPIDKNNVCDVIVKQQNMLLGGKRKEPRTLYMGDPVRIVNFSKSAKNQDKWLAGVVTDKLGPLTYLITLDDGRIFRRHIDHIRLSTNSMTNIGTPQPLDVEVPNVLISDTTAVDGREPLFCDDARTDSPEGTYSSPQVMSPATVQQSPNRALMPRQSPNRALMSQQSPDRASAPLQSTPSAQSQSFDEESSTRDMSSVPVPPIMEATGLRRSTRTTQGQRPARYEQ